MSTAGCFSFSGGHGPILCERCCAVSALGDECAGEWLGSDGCSVGWSASASASIWDCPLLSPPIPPFSLQAPASSSHNKQDPEPTTQHRGRGYNTLPSSPSYRALGSVHTRLQPSSASIRFVTHLRSTQPQATNDRLSSIIRLYNTHTIHPLIHR